MTGFHLTMIVFELA